MAAEERRRDSVQAEDREQSEVEIDLVELLYRLLEKVRYLILAALVGALIMGFYTYRFVQPTHKATSKLYILNSKDSVINMADLQVGAGLAQDYIEVFNNWHVHRMVADRLGLDYTPEKMQRMVSVQNKSATRIIYITITSTSAAEAQQMANTYNDVAREFIAAKMGSEMPTNFEEARLPQSPAAPSKTKNIAIGFLLGFVLAAAVIVVQFIIDDRIRNAEAIEKKLGLSVLGMMPASASSEEEHESSSSRSRKSRGRRRPS